MMRTFPIVAAIVVVLSSGVAQGLWSHRWTASHDIGAAVARLDRVAMKVGDWEGEDQEFDRRQLEQAEIDGYIMRRYKHRRSGALMSILLVCGRTGPIAVHSPDVCYSGAGYELTADPVRKALEPAGGGPPAEFWRGDFSKQNSITPLNIRIYWSWSNGGPWKAPGNSRLTFAGSPVLYKLYVIHGSGVAAERDKDTDPGVEFIQALLSGLTKSLRPAP
jgi:Protein of unknown function (DUF3485)